MPARASEFDRAVIVHLRVMGCSYSLIARLVGNDISHVWRVCAAAGVKPIKQPRNGPKDYGRHALRRIDSEPRKPKPADGSIPLADKSRLMAGR